MTCFVREDLYDGPDGCSSAVHEVANRINEVRLGGMSDMMRQRGDMRMSDQVSILATCSREGARIAYQISGQEEERAETKAIQSLG